MSRSKIQAALEKDAILEDTLKILEGMTSDWQMGFAGQIKSETRLAADLGFESIQVVRLVVALQDHYRRQDLPFQRLFIRDDGVVEDLRVSDLVDFLHVHLNNP